MLEENGFISTLLVPRALKVVLLSIVYPVPHGGIHPGPERVVHRLAATLAKKHVAVSVLTSYWNGGSSRDTVDGVRVFRVPSSGDRIGRIGRAFGLHYITWGKNVLRAKEAFEGADVAHSMCPIPSVAAIKALGLPIISTFHHRARIRLPRDLASVPSLALLERHTFRHSDVVATPSRASREELERYYHVPGDRIHVLPHGVDAPSNVSSSGTDAKELLYVGILERRKGIHVLIQAMARLRPDYPELHLTIAGSGPARLELEGMAVRLGLQDRVTFLGYVKDADLEHLYARSDLFVFPSFQEGFGIVLLEAMGHGLPVVTTTAGAIPEVVGDCAICVEPGRVDSLIGGLRQVLDDASFRGDLSRRGRNHVLRNFSWDSTAKQALELYRSLV